MLPLIEVKPNDDSHLHQQKGAEHYDDEQQTLFGFVSGGVSTMEQIYEAHNRG